MYRWDSQQHKNPSLHSTTIKPVPLDRYNALRGFPIHYERLHFLDIEAGSYYFPVATKRFH